MKRLGLLLTTVALALLALAPGARADFGLSEFDVTFTGSDGAPVNQAGSHPFAMTTSLHFISIPTGKGGEFADEPAKDVILGQIPGFVGNPTAAPRCLGSDFLTQVAIGGGFPVPDCPDASAVGTVTVKVAGEGGTGTFYGAVYNLEPPPGIAAKLGFWIEGFPVTLELGVNDAPPYNIVGGPTNLTQVLEVISSSFTLWGTPAAEAHDPLRGHCIEPGDGSSLGDCPANISEVPFLTLPRACVGPLKTTYSIDSWTHPGALLPNGRPDLSDPNWITGFAETHDASGSPQGFIGCGKLGFNPGITAKPTSKAASSPSGLDFSLDVEDEGLLNPSGLAQSDIRKAVVRLPEGMTVNPSSAEGLEVCSEDDLKRETLAAPPGAGCPDASKLGTVEVETPLLDEDLSGSLFIAEPYENPFGSLIALYLVIENPKLGIIVKQAIEVQPDPETGQLISTADDIPQLPFSHFRVHFREGARSPLVSPPACGSYDVEAELTPWSGGAPITTNSTFELISGANGSSCPQGGTPPFAPGFEGGTTSNKAGAHSPFYMRLTRRDGDQDLTRFAAQLPPGMVAKLAGTTQCPEAAIAAARARTGQNAGHEELASPSCPQSSEIGRVLAGAGVGAVLTYVPGKVYMAGPYKGAPLSVVGVVPAVAGPFDVGVVVTRQALRIDPRTAKVSVDDAASDPIPHILAGIPLKVRDIRVYVDKPDFTLNPTSCARFEVGAQLWGGGADVFGAADDSPVSLASRFQAADCASLGFAPRLALKLKGGTGRGDHPALTGTYRPRAGDANLAGLVLRLPRSAFLDQAHIRTICTRVQFAAKACPAGAIYGQATAYTPLLSEPLSGPVYLRSSNHNLPDFVADLHGLIDVEAVARIDSKRGGIRATFEDVPDAPLAKVVVRMQGGKKGLIVNSRGLCARGSKANAQFAGQNGKASEAKPTMQADCGRKGKRKQKR